MHYFETFNKTFNFTELIPISVFIFPIAVGFNILDN